jgi:CelD/BcsL family acetyltransferase involved in cellulose biosynthesis
MKTTIFRDKTGFDNLACEWDTLLRNSRSNTLFLTHLWQKTWWEYLGQGELMLLAVRDDGGRLVGLGGLFGAPQDGAAVLSTVGCVDVSDYLDWIALSGHERPVYEALLDALNDEPLGVWRELQLCNLPDGSPTLELLPGLAQARGWHAKGSVEDVVPLFRIPESWEAYEQMLPGKRRRELRRKLRKAGPYSGVDWYIVGLEQDLDEEIDAFVDLLIKSHPGKAEFMDARNRAFFHAVGRALFDAGWLQLAFLTTGGRRVATYMNFLFEDRIMVYNSGLDPEAYRLSPGIVLMAHLIRRAIEEGCFRIFDFLRGDEAYKYDLGGTDTYVHRLTITRGELGRDSRDG